MTNVNNGPVRDSTSENTGLTVPLPNAENEYHSIMQFLTQLKSCGYPLLIDKRIVGPKGNDFLQIQILLSKELNEGTGATISDLGSSILNDLSYVYRAAANLPKPLSGKDNVQVPPYILTIEKLSDNQVKVEVKDSLGKYPRLVYQKIVAVNKNGSPKDGDEHLFSGLSKLINNDFSVSSARFQKLLDSLPTIPSLVCEGTAKIDEEKILPAKSQAAAERLLERSNLLKIVTVPSGKAEDETVGSSLLVRSPYEIKLTRQSWKLAQGRPISINGDIDNINLEVKAEIVPEEFRKNGYYRYTDCYGNVIHCSFAYQGKEDLRLIIMPPIALNASEPKEDSVELNIDLTMFGLGKINGLFSRKVHDIITSVGPYSVYTSSNSNEVGSNRSKIEEIARGAEKIERLFGFTPGSQVKEIFIANAHDTNASFAWQNPNMFKVRDPFLSKGVSIEYVGFHEAAHLMDFSMGEISRAGFEAHWLSLKKKNSGFLREIGEKTFFSNIEVGGHAEDNSGELLASFINSFNHPEWEKVMRSDKYSKNFKKDYFDTLVELEKCLLAAEKIPRNAPIFEKIKEMKTVFADIGIS